MNDSSVTPGRLPDLRWRDPWVWAPLASALLLFSALQLAHANTAAFLWLNHANAYIGDGFWAQITVLGDGLTVAALLLPLANRRPRLVWAGLLAALLAGLWVHGIKHFIPMPRPAAVLAADAFHVIGHTYYAGSFPSGHATAIFALASLLTLGLLSPRWRWAPLVPAIVVAVSRSVVGAHWPLDLLGGMFGGWLAGVIALRLAAVWDWGVRPIGRRFVLVLLSLLALTLPLYNTGYDAARALQVVLGLGLLLLAALDGAYRWRAMDQRA